MITDLIYLSNGLLKLLKEDELLPLGILGAKNK